MSRIWNFSAGPAALPEEVLLQAQEELLDWHGSGCSVMEMSHRGKEFTSIIEQAEADLRELMSIPAGYRVLFLQGGATQRVADVLGLERRILVITVEHHLQAVALHAQVVAQYAHQPIGVLQMAQALLQHDIDPVRLLQGDTREVIDVPR